MNAVDQYYAYRFIKLLTQDWHKTDAYKLGLIDRDGNRTEKEITSSKEKKAYTLFHRLVFNVKRIMEKFPLGKTTVARYAAALHLIKENFPMYGERVIDDFTEYLNEENDYEVGEQLYHTRELNEEIINEAYGGDKDFIVMPEAFILGIPVYRMDEETTGIYDQENSAMIMMNNEETVTTGNMDIPSGPTKLKGNSDFPKMAGVRVFDVDTDRFIKSKNGKKKFARWDRYVGEDETGQKIKEYGKKNRKSSIILRDEKTGAMLYLRKTTGS